MIDPAELHWICSVPVGASIAAIGLFGNIISVIIWNRINESKSRRNRSTAFYFVALALCDTSLLVSFLLHDSLPSNHPDLKQNYYYASAFAWFLFPMFFFSLVASIWMVIGVTINRYIMIAFPTKVSSLYTNFKTKLGIFGIMVFAFCVNLPHFFTYHVADRNGTYNLEFTEYGHSDASIKYEFWAHCIVLVLVPWFTIAVLNALIIFNLRKQMKKFHSVGGKTSSKKTPKSKNERKEHQMTRMLLTTTFTFLVLLAWQCITQCFWMLQYGKHDSDQSKWIMVDSSFALAKLGVIINSSINWFLYCITSSMFRKEMRKLFRINDVKKSGNQSINSSSISATKSTTMNSEAAIIVNTRL